jgi:hypothetical protein
MLSSVIATCNSSKRTREVCKRVADRGTPKEIEGVEQAAVRDVE